MTKINKNERQEKLIKILNENPFLTDEKLAKRFQVSIQTIRLDRLELKIPEMRERTKSLARSAYSRLKSVSEGEVIGELIKLKLNQSAESYLETNEDMALKKTHIIRGHYIFAQANSLAVAVIDAQEVVTGSANIKYIRPVYVNEILQAKAEVKTIKAKKVFVDVKISNNSDLVFSGNFIMFIQKNGG